MTIWKDHPTRETHRDTCPEIPPAARVPRLAKTWRVVTPFRVAAVLILCWLTALVGAWLGWGIATAVPVGVFVGWALTLRRWPWERDE